MARVSTRGWKGAESQVVIRKLWPAGFFLLNGNFNGRNGQRGFGITRCLKGIARFIKEQVLVAPYFSKQYYNRGKAGSESSRPASHRCLATSRCIGHTAGAFAAWSAPLFKK